MAIINENSLKAEELRSGYDGAEQDVDIFLQSDGKAYPGELPWREEPSAELSPEPEEPELELIGTAKEETIDEEQNRLDAIFGDGDFEEEEDPLFGRMHLTAEEEEALGSIKSEREEKDSEGISARASFELDEHESFQDRNSIDHGVKNDKSNRGDSKIIEGAVENRDNNDYGIESGDGVTVDISSSDLSDLNDLRASLKEELEAPILNPDPVEPPVSNKPFENVKNDPKAKIIEIPDMERASGSGIPEPFEFTTISGGPFESDTAKGSQSEETTETASEKSDRKKRRFLWIAGIAAAVVLAVSATGYYYLSDLFTAKPQSELDSNRTFLSAIAEKLGFNGKDEKAPMKGRNVKNAKITYDEKAARKRLQEKKSYRAAQKEQSTNASAPIATTTPKPEVVRTQPPAPKPEASKIIIIEKPKAPAPKPAPVVSKLQRPMPSPRTNAQPKSAAPKKATLKPIQAPVAASTERQSVSGEGVYTVQVYSTPSREVAEQILNKLLRRNIAGAYISKQNLREVTYYRVRFGKYSSQEQARQAAARAGYPQSWIDRIK